MALQNYAQGLLRVATAVAALGLCHCAAPMSGLSPGYVATDTLMSPAGGVTFQNQSAYQSYHAPTLSDASDYTFVRFARGKACQRGISVPLSALGAFVHTHGQEAAFGPDIRWGEGTLDEAMAQAMAHALPDEVLTDVTLDVQVKTILGVLYREICLIVQGKVMAPNLPQNPLDAASSVDDKVDAAP